MLTKKLYADFLEWYNKDYGTLNAKNEFTSGYTDMYILSKINNSTWLISTNLVPDLHYCHLVLDHSAKTADIVQA